MVSWCDEWHVMLDGVLHQMFGNWVQQVIKNWEQSDLWFCKNEELKRSKINEKRG